jgi:hypothetical protein
MSWEKFLQDGLNTAIDGVVAVKTAKASTPEQIPPSNPIPVTPPEAVKQTLKQNNIVLGGVSLNKTVLGVVGGVIGLLLVIKAVK